MNSEPVACKSATEQNRGSLPAKECEEHPNICCEKNLHFSLPSKNYLESQQTEQTEQEPTTNI